MNLYLIRHSFAENPSQHKSDFNRELTTEGKKIALIAGQFLKKIVSKLNLILTSPYIRAYQTSELISKAFNNDIQIIKENNLTSGCNTGTLLEILNIYNSENIAVVGHQPDISNHISNLTSNGNINLIFKPCSIAKIKFDSKPNYNKGYLEILVSSDMLK